MNSILLRKSRFESQVWAIQVVREANLTWGEKYQSWANLDTYFGIIGNRYVYIYIHMEIYRDVAEWTWCPVNRNSGNSGSFLLDQSDIVRLSVKSFKTATRSGYSGHLARHDKWTFPFSTGLFFGGRRGILCNIQCSTGCSACEMWTYTVVKCHHWGN